jgi:hypothetical protein
MTDTVGTTLSNQRTILGVFSIRSQDILTAIFLNDIHVKAINPSIDAARWHDAKDPFEWWGRKSYRHRQAKAKIILGVRLHPHPRRAHDILRMPDIAHLLSAFNPFAYLDEIRDRLRGYIQRALADRLSDLGKANVPNEVGHVQGSGDSDAETVPEVILRHQIPELASDLGGVGEG